MRLTVLVPLLAFPASALAAEPAAACHQAEAQQVGNGGGVRIRPLAEQPPARQIKLLLRSKAGCLDPIVVADRVTVVPQTSSTSRP